MPDFSIGVDLGGTNLRVAAVTPEGRILEQVSIETNVSLGPDLAIDKMCAAIQQLIAKYKNDNLRGVGLGLPGIIDIENGIMRKAANLPGWANYPARAEIERRLRGSGILENRTRVVVENDARAAGLGENWIGAGRGVRNMAMLTLGTGIGGCVILNGKIWHGINGMAGEFGHITVEPDGQPCGCGNRGCAERYASASAIMRMAQEAIANGASSLAQAASSDAEFRAKSIYNLAVQGDESARKIFRTFGRYLGILLADLVNVLNLEMYVIGGGVASAWEAFAPTMMDELVTRSIVFGAVAANSASCADSSNAASSNKEDDVSQPPSNRNRKTVITRALLGSDAGLYGAAHLAELANQNLVRT
jgi:glucokinase